MTYVYSPCFSLVVDSAQKFSISGIQPLTIHTPFVILSQQWYFPPMNISIVAYILPAIAPVGVCHQVCHWAREITLDYISSHGGDNIGTFCPISSIIHAVAPQVPGLLPHLPVRGPDLSLLCCALNTLPVQKATNLGVFLMVSSCVAVCYRFCSLWLLYMIILYTSTTVDLYSFFIGHYSFPFSSGSLWPFLYSHP